MKKSNIVYVKGYFARTDEEPVNRVAVLQQEKNELKAQISVLLSCKDCPENKGGYLCQKEYEGKCLAQKTQYIKELKEEIAELRKDKEEQIAFEQWVKD